MKQNLADFIIYIEGYVNETSQLIKAEMQHLAEKKFNLTKKRSVFFNEHFAVRFCEVNYETNRFSNTILSLSALKLYDENPFLVCIAYTKLKRIDLLI